MSKTPFKNDFDPFGAMGLGLINGVSNFSSFGAAEILSGSLETDMTRLWDLLAISDVPLPNNSGESLEILSDDITDNANITIIALGPGGVTIPPVSVTLNGVTPVIIPGQISRINAAFTDDDNGHAGDLIIQQSGGGTIYAGILEKDQMLNQGRFTIPSNTLSYVGNLIGAMQKSGGNNSDIIVVILFKRFTQLKWRLPFGFGLQRDGDTSIEFDNKHPQQITGPFDIKLRCTSSSNGAGAASFFSGSIYDT